MTFMLDKNVVHVDYAHLIVCEGFGDAQFICRLLQHENIQNCCVGCPSEAGGHGTGISAIPRYLKSMQAMVKLGKAFLKAILVIVDADNDPLLAFERVREDLREAGFPAPEQAFSLEGSSPKTGIFIVPGKDRLGTLENLLWDAAKDAHPHVEACLESFLGCTKGSYSQAGRNKQAKMRLSILAGTYCRSNPWTSLGLIWSDPGNPIPIDSLHFKELASFLSEFAAI